MSGADYTLYRRMRGVFWGLLMIGVIGLPIALLLAMTVPAKLELYTSTTIEAIGNTESVAAGGFALAGVLALLAAVILGATAGSVDLQRGVLRDLVLAGRSRARIVIGRLIAAMLLLLLVAALSYAAIVLVAVTLAPIASDPAWSEIARNGAQFLPALLYVPPLAAGVALLVGSRGPAIAVYFIFALVIDNVLGAVPKVGEWWRHVSLSRADGQLVSWILDSNDDWGRPLWQACVILAAWSLGLFVLGLVRLSRRDL